ncbi:glycosyltransferase family 4 protein [Candidatus Bathyarchaeota archaeon]|nr:glycosyltransferase family 4 protein [Candidatus Bathyarchaeota archaeon]
MNICVVNTLFFPHISGTARAAFLLSNELSKKEHTVIVVTSKLDDTPQVERLNGLTIYRLRSVRYPRLNILHRAELYCNLVPGNFGAIASILRKHKIDVVHVFGQFFDLTLMTIAACKMLKIPTVLTIGTRMEHPQFLYNSLFELFDRTLVRYLVARRVDRLIALDKLMRDYMIKRYGVDRRLVKFIPVGVDVQRFEKCDGRPVRMKYGIGDKEPVFLSLGTISNLRNPLSLVKAIPNVMKEFPNLKILFAGALYNREVVRLVERLGLKDSIVFCGKVDYNMVPSYLGACEVEGHDLDSGLGIGLAGLEALAAGKPVLSSAKEDNFIDIRLENWKNIVLVRPGNLEDISQAMIKLFSDARLREEIGQNAKKLLKERFSLGRMCQEHEILYNEIG